MPLHEFGRIILAVWVIATVVHLALIIGSRQRQLYVFLFFVGWLLACSLYLLPLSVLPFLGLWAWVGVSYAAEAFGWAGWRVRSATATRAPHQVSYEDVFQG